MLFIYKENYNKAIRNALKPFAKAIPVKYRFPINGSFDVEIGAGKRVNISCNPTSYLSRLLFWGGEQGFEYKTVRIFKELIKDCETFFDIGSNIGYYSLVASALNPNVKIVAFEPMPAANKYLHINANNNHIKNIVIEQTALSNTTGTATFYAVKSRKFMEIKDHLNGDGTINSDNATANTGEQFEVKTETLDNYVKLHNIAKIDLIKIDTEASEHLVFMAATEVLTKHRPIIFCEVIPNKIEAELNTILKQNNYTFYKAYEAGLKHFDNLTDSYDAAIDYICVPLESTAVLDKFLIK